MPAIPRDVLNKIRYSDIHSGEGMYSLAEINQKLGANINLITYLRLGEAIVYFTRNFTGNARRISDGSAITLENFLLRFKNGSRPLRVLLTRSRKQKKVEERTHVKTFLRLADIGNPDTKHIMNSQEFWSYSFIPNSIREFILKFNSNLLGINTRVGHFVANHSRSCTFCTAKHIVDPPDETFKHLFFECNFTNRYLALFESIIFPEKIGLNLPERRLLWFLGVFDNTLTKNNTFLGSCLWVIKYLIWGYKLKKRVPNNIEVIHEFYYTMGNIFDASERVRFDKANYNNSFCRNWDTLRRQ